MKRERWGSALVQEKYQAEKACDKRHNNSNNNNNNNVLKYEDLTKGIKRMWNVKAIVLQVIIGATETISKSLNIPGKHDIKTLQKTATFGTAHMLLKVLS